MRLVHAPPLQGYFDLSLYNATLHVSSATINANMYSELLVYLGSQLNDNRFLIRDSENIGAKNYEQKLTGQKQILPLNLFTVSMTKILMLLLNNIHPFSYVL